ncbi:MAG: NAD+ synthase [Dehalococcoidia bacterium]|nr:NAD+ synthase [Dehalococcoidia bacterium]
MRTLRLGMAQVNPTVGDLEGNAHKVLEFLKEARDLDVDLVAFPELVITGYPPEDLLFKPQFIQDNLKVMREVASRTQGITAVYGFVDAQGDIHNAAAVASDGRLVGIYHKMFLPTYGVFDEDRYFKPGRTCPVFTINGVAVGVNICEDIWYAMGPTAVQREADAELIVNINGSPYHAGKRLSREKMLATRASDNGLYISYTNMVGGQDELVFDGGSMVFDPSGDRIAIGSQFAEELVVVDINADAGLRARLHDPRRRKGNLPNLAVVGTPERVFVSGDPGSKARRPLPQRTPAIYDPVGEVYTALVTGTRDYIRKSGFQRVIIGMSGGIDSTLVACVAADALGKEGVLGVAMPSRYSSEGSILDARSVAENLGMDLWVIPIEEAFSAYLNTLEPHFRDTKPNVAEENIQARIRGNLLMAISNKFGWLVLTTGNKSEMATGYATLYGDMAGGLAVIKDVPKTLVYRLAEWRNSQGPKPVIPQAVMAKPPSAELRPDQKDEDTLPPYAVLDPILKAYVEEDKSYGEIVGMGYDAEMVKQIIAMVDRNEYKRRQAPPGVKITPRAFGRDRRLPLVNRYRQF